MTSREEVVSRIDRAFEGAAMPRTERELAEPGIDAPYVIVHFLGLSREDIKSSTFLPSLHMEDFRYMTAQAVEYYLPPVLKLMLSEPFDFELWIFLSGFLTSARQQDERTLRGLRHSQNNAIADMIELLCRESDGAYGFEPKKAAKLAVLYRQLAQVDNRR